MEGGPCPIAARLLEGGCVCAAIFRSHFEPKSAPLRTTEQKQSPGRDGLHRRPALYMYVHKGSAERHAPSPDTPCAPRPERPHLTTSMNPRAVRRSGFFFVAAAKRKAPPTKRGTRGRILTRVRAGRGHPNPCHVRLLLVGARPLPRRRSPVQRAGDSRRIRYGPVRACRGQDRLLVEAHFLCGCSENATVGVGPGSSRRPQKRTRRRHLE
jgi:hypothetical protein